MVEQDKVRVIEKITYPSSTYLKIQFRNDPQVCYLNLEDLTGLKIEGKLEESPIGIWFIPTSKSVRLTKAIRR